MFVRAGCLAMWSSSRGRSWRIVSSDGLIVALTDWVVSVEIVFEQNGSTG